MPGHCEEYINYILREFMDWLEKEGNLNEYIYDTTNPYEWVDLFLKERNSVTKEGPL